MVVQRKCDQTDKTFDDSNVESRSSLKIISLYNIGILVVDFIQVQKKKKQQPL